MSMQDPIADMFTRIRNGQMAKLTTVKCLASKVKKTILNILKEEGYITDYRDTEIGDKPGIEVTLKYFDGAPVIEKIKRVSKPGLRLYEGSKKLRKVNGGLGIVIISTSKGIMTDKSARAANLGGEVIAEVA
jgi:small subunit ribosomal protein S8